MIFLSVIIKIDGVIVNRSCKNKKCVFLLLGNYAKNKEKFIENKSMIVTGPHPSPLARGFINSKIFIKVENILDKKINWEIL